MRKSTDCYFAGDKDEWGFMKCNKSAGRPGCIEWGCRYQDYGANNLCSGFCANKAEAMLIILRGGK